MNKFCNRMVKSLFVIAIFCLILMGNLISVKAHSTLLHVKYDTCNPVLNDEGDNETWYYLNEWNYSKGETYEYYHLSDETDTIKYYFKDSDAENTDYEWDDDVSKTVAKEIKDAYVNSMKKWNDVYFYSYDSNGNKTENKVINVEEAASEADSNLVVFPLRNNNSNGNIVLTGINGENNKNDISTNIENNTHTHYHKWRMRVNVSYFYDSDIEGITSETAEMIRQRTGAHEIGHVLGLDDIDKCCQTEVNVNGSLVDEEHHEELLMGYGDLSNRQTEITYKDIAGVSITRGFHTDNDHIWMKRTNSNGKIDLICAICNGVLFDVTLDSNNTTYQGKTLNNYQSCVHHNGTNYNMLLVATNGKSDFFKCLYCRHIESVRVDAGIETVNIDSTNYVSYLVNNTSYVKFNINYQADYDFTITSGGIIDINLYDSHLNEVNIEKEIHILEDGGGVTFNKMLTPDTYYIKVSNPSLMVYVGMTHSHLYNYSFTWVDTTNHRGICSCGAYIMQGHAVLKGQSICVSCGGIADMGFIQMSINSNLITKVTINGSYILPNGIIVLDEKDLQSYLNNTLVFYNKNEISLIK